VKTGTPAVSVCVPVHNGARFIGEALASVLRQDFDDFEVVVVDNASTDGTPEAVEAFADPRIRLFRNDANIGAEANWNRAAGLARGEFVKLLCADDFLTSHCLASQVEAMESHPEVSLVAGRRDVVDESGRVLISGRGLGRPWGVVDGPRAIRASVRAGTNIFGEPACVLMRRAQMDECGTFSARYPYVIDLDYWCRLLRLGSLYAQPIVVAGFRVALGSWSVGLARRQSSQAAALFRELQARDPHTIRDADVLVGTVTARALAVARGTSYRLLARRAAGLAAAGLPGASYP
jgi:glycosyltransferase involved in cell wall biosynthesis